MELSTKLEIYLLQQNMTYPVPPAAVLGKIHPGARQQ
jgi:hypothetical protein